MKKHHGLAHAVDLTENRKTGIASVTYASQQSCPPTCALRGMGCYAESGPTAIWTMRVNEADPNATALDVAYAEADAIREVISGRFDLRLHVVGDCPTNEAAEVVSEAALEVLRKGRTAWAYTHAWRNVDREKWDRVSVLASCDTHEEVKEAQARGWATAIVVPEYKSDRLYEEKGIKILPCPYQTRGVQCSDCGLCKNDTLLRNKGYAIGFEAHGARAKTAARVLTQRQQLVQLERR